MKGKWSHRSLSNFRRVHTSWKNADVTTHADDVTRVLISSGGLCGFVFFNLFILLYFIFFKQGFCFGKSGEVLTLTLRLRAFKSMMRQVCKWQSQMREQGGCCWKIHFSWWLKWTNYLHGSHNKSWSGPSVLLSNLLCRIWAGLTNQKTVLVRSLRDWPQMQPKCRG